MCTPLDLVTVPQPHFIPGYTGYCPQYIFRAGNTYGSCTHKVLVDPTIIHSKNLVLADRTTDDYQVYRPSQNDIDIVKSRFRQANTIYQHPMIPGYEGGKKDCTVCSNRKIPGKRRQTHTYCDTCTRKPGLHIGDCFAKYHSLEDYRD